MILLPQVYYVFTQEKLVAYPLIWDKINDRVGGIINQGILPSNRIVGWKFNIVNSICKCNQPAEQTGFPVLSNQKFTLHVIF